MRSHTRAQLFAGVGAGAFLSLAAAVPAAHSQATVTPQAGEITEVVVTAQRRSESAQDVPIPITTHTAESLEAAGIQAYSDIAVLTPGLQFQAVGFSQVPFLRGVGASTTGAGAEQGVALYVDDVYLPSAPAATMSLNNVDNVAVLRGPQGTLFGRNATGGVVQVTTRTPGQDPRFDATFGVGNHRTIDGTLYASAPLSDKIAADIAVFARNVDKGWGRNLATGDRIFKSYDRAARTRWEFQLADETQLTLIGQYFQIKTQGGFASARLGPGELGQNERYAGGVIANEGFYDVSLNDWSGSTTKIGTVSAKLTQGLGFAEFRSITAFSRLKAEGYVDFDFTAARLTYVHIPPREDTLSQEFQLVSPADSESPFTWVTGLYLYRNIAQYDGQLTIVPGVFNQILHSKQNTNSWSVFGEGSYKISEATKLTAGIRYNRDRREFAGATLTLPAAGGSVYAPSSGEKTYPRTTFKISLDHHFTDDLMGYATFSTGFKSGFFTTQTIQVTPGQPTVALPVNEEKVEAYEVGFKSILMNRQLRLNASAFYYDYTDLQLNAFLNNTTRVTLNVKAAEIYGLDVEAEFHPTDQLYFTLSAEWLHARYTDFTNAPFFTPRTAAPWGLVASIGNANGNNVPQSPDFSATLGVNYTVPVGGGELSLNGSAQYNGGFYFEPMNRLKQSDFVLLNGTVKWTAPGGRYDVSLWGRNLGDEKIYGSANPTINGDAAEPREPRTFGVRLGVHY